MRNIPLFFLLALLSYLSEVSTGKNDCPRIKLKRQWGGKPATAITYQVPPIRYVIIHHTVSDECDQFLKCASILQSTQIYHMNDLKYDDIGYNFLIGNDGVIYEGTGWGVRGAHTYGYNMNGTGIAFIGNYAEKLPSRSALNAAKKLLACGVKEGELDRNYILLAASQVISTHSPGLILYNEIQDWDHWSINP
ncbi:PREDICTED: peptidoglycan-recognition protein SA-like [Rhagoletis zephyria]|uniref:peptidoglycan-recognition protein SA-like n=1 Tax=Rhagoletis zephyria TaxID=28612 RepID=UPI00081180D3|nr:PREDICTED: peptidoglycan-recognition protein SA-like [Rhagoletis zephyria]